MYTLALSVIGILTIGALAKFLMDAVSNYNKSAYYPQLRDMDRSK